MSFHPLWFDVLGFFQSLIASRAAETRDESIVDRPVVHAEYYSEARKRIISRDGDVHDDNINSRQGAERKKVDGNVPCAKNGVRSLNVAIGGGGFECQDTSL
jgi:hypothetical protein